MVLTENRSTTLALIANNSTHGGSCGLDSNRSSILSQVTLSVECPAEDFLLRVKIYLAPAA